MKKCPDCGAEYLGFAKLCDVCRRRPKMVASEVQKSLRESVKALVEKAVDGDVAALKMVADGVSRLSPGDLCPHCGMKYRPKVSAADRQRKCREKKRGG